MHNRESVSQLRRLLQAALAAKEIELPVLDEVVAKIIWLARQPTGDARRIAEIVMLDAGLAARLFRLVNSSLFAPKVPVSDLRSAIARLGVDVVVGHVVGVANHGTFRSTDPGYNKMLLASWRWSVFTAAAGRLVAPHVGQKPGEAYLAGLLSGIGTPVLTVLTERLVEEDLLDRPPLDVLLEAIGPLAPGAARRLILEWGLPTSLAEVIAHQAHPEKAPGEARAGAALLGAARLLACHSICGGRSLEEIKESSAVEFLDLDGDAVDIVAEQTVVEGRELLAVYDDGHTEGPYDCACCSTMLQQAGDDEGESAPKSGR